MKVEFFLDNHSIGVVKENAYIPRVGEILVIPPEHGISQQAKVISVVFKKECIDVYLQK